MVSAIEVVYVFVSCYYIFLKSCCCYCLSQLPAWFNKFSSFARYIAFSNSAFNPIIYTGFNDNFKRG